MHVQCCSVFVQCMSVRYRAFLGISVVFKTSSDRYMFNLCSNEIDMIIDVVYNVQKKSL